MTKMIVDCKAARTPPPWQRTSVCSEMSPRADCTRLAHACYFFLVKSRTKMNVRNLSNAIGAGSVKLAKILSDLSRQDVCRSAPGSNIGCNLRQRLHSFATTLSNCGRNGPRADRMTRGGPIGWSQSSSTVTCGMNFALPMREYGGVVLWM